MAIEAALEKSLNFRIKKLGGKCIKLTGYKGIPDRLVLLPGRKAYFVELKTKDGELSATQWNWFDKIKYLGFPAIIIHDREAINQFFPLPKPW